MTTPAARMMLSLGWAGFLLLANGTPPAYPAITPEEGSRIHLAVLPLENRTGDPDLAFWTHAATDMLRTRLYALHTVKGAPASKAIEAWKKTGLKPGAPLHAEEVRQLGRELQRRYVPWGHYGRTNAQWQITTRILETDTGKSSPDFTAQAGFWLDAADEIVAQIIRYLKLSPTEEEQRKMARRLTESPAALEWAAKAAVAEIEEKPVEEVEALLRKALAADPESDSIRMFVVGALGAQDKLDEARELTRHVLASKPDSYRAHLLMGRIELEALGNLEAAEEHLKKAAELEPAEAVSFALLGRLYSLQAKWSEAIAAYEQELERDPEDTSLWATLSKLHRTLGQMEQARQAAARAVEFNDGSALALLAIAVAYAGLEDIPKANQYYEQLRALARTGKVDETALKELADALHVRKQRSSPSYIQAERPRRYSVAELQEALQSTLTKEELALAKNPIDATPELNAWAWKIVGAETNGFVKAKRLFETLDKRVHQWGKGGTRTAVEVHASWKDPGQSFSCQEYAKLYVALAREVGLDAYYVHLDKDFEGRAVYHDCAGVFLDQGCLLADPAYGWFGVPHQKAVVMDDLQVLSHHALQGADVARCRMALKLHPDLAWNRVQLAKAFFAEDRLNEAEQELEKAQALEPDRWDIRQLRGAIAMERGDWVTAENELKKSVETNPKGPKTHLALANLQHRQLKLEGAKQSLLAALEHARNRGDREAMDAVLKGLSLHQELAAARQGDRSAKGGLWKRAEAGEAEAQNTLAALLLHQPKPAYQEAMKWLRRAAEQGEALASLNLAEKCATPRLSATLCGYLTSPRLASSVCWQFWPLVAPG